MNILRLLLGAHVVFANIFTQTPMRSSFSNKYSMPFAESDFVPGLGDSSATASTSAYNFTNTSAFSISFWNKDTTATGGIVSRQQAGATCGVGYSVYVAGGKYYFDFVSNGTTCVGINVNSTSTYSSGAWSHFVVTYSGSGAASGVTMYINGSSVAVTTTKDTLATFSGQTAAFVIGYRITGAPEPSYYLTGNLDEISIWNTELTAAQVTAIYNSGKAYELTRSTAQRSLLGWYRMGDSNDTNAALIARNAGGFDSYNSIASSGWAYSTDIP